MEIGPHLPTILVGRISTILVGRIRNMRLSTDGVCIKLLTLGRVDGFGEA